MPKYDDLHIPNSQFGQQQLVDQTYLIVKSAFCYRKGLIANPLEEYKLPKNGETY
jgi:hypothetical protein